MTTNAETLARAWNACQSGNLTAAAGLYRQALQNDASNADAWCMLGIVSRALGQLDEAVQAYHQALRLRPEFLEAQNNLGNVLQSQGKLDEAIACYRQVLRQRPDSAQTHNNLGAALASQDRLTEAVACYREALRCKPDYIEAYAHLGAALAKLGSAAEAVQVCQQAIAVAPHSPAAHNAMGVALARFGKIEEALAHYQHALWLQPNFVDAHLNRGNALLEQGKHAEAEASYRQVLALKPDAPDGHANLGIALAEQQRLPEAEASYRRALALKPDHAEAHANLGNALLHQGKVAEALTSYTRAVQLRPDHAEAHLGKALALLTLGDLRQGFTEHEWRWKSRAYAHAPTFTQPLWDGSPLDGRTILLHAESGLGDTVQFIRYAPLVKERAGTVVVACQKALLGLLAHCRGIDRLVPTDPPLPPHDVCAPLLSLPHIFGTTLETIPSEVPYLFIDQELIEPWRSELEQEGGFRIGIAWETDPQFRQFNYTRRIPLTQFAELAAVPGVRLVSLQKGPGTEQLPSVAGLFPVRELGSRLDETSGPFMDTAAVMKGLDLVVTADMSLTHVAGALGVPVWLAQPFAPNWRWLLDRPDSPWYPSMRLFRQTEPGNWGPVFRRMAEELARRVARTLPV